jgi:DHA1 family L-arabinose/isopropyl-beta-D-thiogalactopyranoside export protein-like MFS transporter
MKTVVDEEAGGAGRATALEPRHRFLLGALSLGHLSNDWVAGTLWLLAPAIAAAMGLGPAEVGLILTVNGIGAGLAYIPAGMLSDRSSRPGLLMLLSFWWVAIGYLAATVAPGFWAVTLLLAFGVMGDAFWHPVATGALVKALPGRRAQALGIHAIGGSIGAEVLAPLSTGFLLGYFEWQTALQILVLPVVLMGIAFVPVAARIGRDHPPARPQPVDFAGMLRQWSRPAGLLLIAMMILYNMALVAQLAMAPLYFQQQHGMSPLEAGAIFACILVVGSLFQPLLGKFSDSRDRKPLVLVVLFAASFFALFASLADNLTWAILGLLPSIAMLTAVRPVVLAAAVEYSAKAESTTLGIVFTVLDGVGMLGALAAGIVGEFELAFAFMLGAALAFAAALICLLLRFPRGELPVEHAAVSPVASPGDP